MESNLSRIVNGYEYYDVSFLPNQIPNLGFGVPSMSEFDLSTNHHHHQPSIWVPATEQDKDLDQLHHHDQYSPPASDEIDSENTLLKYVNQLLMEEETLSESQSMSSYDALALRQTEEMLQQVINDSLAQSPYITPPDSITSSTTSSGGSSGGGGEYLNSNSNSCVRIETEADSAVSLRGFGQPANEILVRSMFSDADSVNQFKRGLEEASKFLPNTDQWIFNLEQEVVPVKDEKGFSRVRKHHYNHEPEEEARRSSKQSAANVDDGNITELFDKVLLLDNQLNPHIKEEEEEADVNNVSSKSPANTKEGGRAKKKSKAVDFRTLLTLCAQSISSGDKLAADELLKQIKKQCSPLGDASQRLAYFFTKALEARLQGSSGVMIQSYYDSITSKKRTAAQILKTYKAFLSASPFMTLIYFFSNKMILDASKDASVLHIIDFGILYGFQWPMFIQYISKSKTGPRKLRITAVELPQNGFRPTEKIEDTGRRLREYCKRFGVPFEYNAIASKNWETIRLEEFKIRPNEVLAVNSVLRFKNLRDVTPGEEDCPRDGFLKLIRDMKPDVFLSSTINGSFNAPFFATRFKEALFHYSSLFDMFGSTLSKENPERMHFEGEFFGREVMNVIACEGVDRVERPETYKQWQVRMVRAGFKQKPVEAELMESFREKMKKWGYHKDFVLDQDSNWFLQGWKGRILFSSSCWVPS
ncbi:Scarecrow-like protein 31 [Raphanus sativus]|nr:Scarecrow-like protein 31 [Raphanus sativus]